MIKIKILSALAMLVLSTPFAMAQTATPVTIAIAVDGFQFTPLYVARANDYFKAEGLAVQLLPSGGGAKAMTSVLSGSANVLAAVASEVINADNHGQNVEIFAALLERPVMSVVVQREIATREGLSLTSPLDKRLAALRGLKIGISSTRSASDAITRVILTRAHLDPARDVEIVPTGGAANQVAAFLAGKVDAFTGTSPSPEEVLARGQGVELFDVGNGDVELYQHYPWTVISAKRDWLQSNPTVVRGLIRAFAKAQQFVRENPEEPEKSCGMSSRISTRPLSRRLANATSPRLPPIRPSTSLRLQPRSPSSRFSAMTH